MSADVVREMNEVCALGTYPATEGYGIINQLMAVVWLLETKGIDNEDVDVMEVFVF